MRESFEAHSAAVSPGTSAPTHDTSVCQAFTPSPVVTYSREPVLTWLQTNVPEPRIRHIVRVEQMAIELAQIHHLDTAKAGQAGLLHDLAKYFKPDRLLQMIQAEGWELDPVEEANPRLLHAEVGAIVARDEFGVDDEEVLQAIRNHTLGQPGMSPLSCVVFLADTLEPGRGNTPELEGLRRWSRQDLETAMWHTADYSLRYLLESRHLIHPRTILTRNWFMQVALRKSKPFKAETVSASTSFPNPL